MNQSDLDAISVDRQKRGKTPVMITFGFYFWLVKKMASDFYSQPRSRYIEAMEDQLKTLDMNVNLTETLNLTVLIVLSSSQPMLTYILPTQKRLTSFPVQWNKNVVNERGVNKTSQATSIDYPVIVCPSCFRCSASFLLIWPNLNGVDICMR